MDAALVAGLKANAIVADSGLRTVSRLAGVTGADAVVAPVVARTLDDVEVALMELSGRDAQSVIGPGVNFAWGARQSVTALSRSARDGVMPTVASVDDILTRVGLLSQRINAVPA